MAEGDPKNGGASLADILTVQKNAVVALGTLNQNLSTANQYALDAVGSKTVVTRAATVLVRTGTGYVSTANVVFVGGGPSVGYIFDCISATASPPNGPDTTNYTNALAVLPDTVGNYPIKAFYAKGLVILAGTNQVVSVTYSIVT